MAFPVILLLCFSPLILVALTGFCVAVLRVMDAND